MSPRAYTVVMPMYEFRCRSCGDTYTEQRPMSASGEPSVCPAGHEDTVRLLTVAGALISGGGSEAPSGGGCCGGGCCA
jgi:putative FmdB family regulatory protein